MSRVSSPATRRRIRTPAAARWWNLLIVVDIVAALIIQLVLVLTGGPDPNTGETVASVGIPVRMLQTISFFTIQSNIIALVAAVTLVRNPDRDGRTWRILRLDALLGIVITGLVFDLILIRYVHPSGWQLVATIGLHYVAPWTTLLGWLIFGPFGRIDRRTAVWAFAWPLAWVGYTFVHGAISHWYPYPFVNVTEIGYAAAVRNMGFVLVLGLVLVAVFWRIDIIRGRTRRTALPG